MREIVRESGPLLISVFRLPSAMDNRPLVITEFESIAEDIIYVSATPGKKELECSETVAEQLIRPTGLLDPEN